MKGSLMKGQPWICVGLLLSGCGGGEPAQELPIIDSCGAVSSPQLDKIELWKLDLMKADFAFNEAVQRIGPSQRSEFFVPEGSLIQEGVGEIQGPEAIHTQFLDAITSNALAQFTWLPERAEVSRGGDLGYTVGNYQSVVAGEAGARKQING